MTGRQAHGPQETGGIAGDGPGAAPAQQPAAGAVPAPARAAVVAGNRPGSGSRTAAPDLAAVHAGGRLGPGSAPPRDGQDPPLAGLLPRGHMAAPLGGIRRGGRLGLLVGGAAPGLVPRARGESLLRRGRPVVRPADARLRGRDPPRPGLDADASPIITWPWSWRRHAILPGSPGCASWPRPGLTRPGRTPGSRRPGSRSCWPARAASSATSPSETAWSWPTPSGGCRPAAARRKSTSTSASTPSGSSPADAPATIRAFGMAQGQLTVEELVDRYRLQCKPVRDLLVDYLRERQPALDYASMQAIASTLAGLFWARIEALSPGISTLRLPPDVARAWKEDLQTVKRTVTGPDGQKTVVTSPRLNAKGELLRVRAFYLDIAQWATEEPDAGRSGRSRARSATPRSAGPRNAGAARPGWTSGPASGCPSCPSSPAPPPSARTRRPPGSRPPSRHRPADHRGHRRDAPPGRGPQGHRQARVGRGHRHRQAPQPVL